MREQKILQLKITLARTKPPIWRRIRVPESITLADLHTAIQIVMGWENSHLHEFEIKGTRYTEFEEDIQSGARDSRACRLEDLGLRRKNQKFRYIYDFGDDWLHEIVVESAGPGEPKEVLPVCIAGKRACPPEDSGGVFGFYRILEAISTPEHPDHDEISEWIDPDFDPLVFSKEVVNVLLRKVCANT